MKTKWAAVALALIYAGSCVLPTWGQKQIFEADPAKSQVDFTLEATLHAVHGTFHLEHGTIDFTRGTSQMAGLISVDAHSGNSGESSRDKKMTTDELKADKFTAITFAPKTYTGQLAPGGDSDIVVAGVFTLLGTPHDITLPMHVHIDHAACTVTGTFAVPFVQWGVKDPSTFLLKVGKQVNVALTLVGSLTPVAP